MESIAIKFSLSTFGLTIYQNNLAELINSTVKNVRHFNVKSENRPE